MLTPLSTTQPSGPTKTTINSATTQQERLLMSALPNSENPPLTAKDALTAMVTGTLMPTLDGPLNKAQTLASWFQEPQRQTELGAWILTTTTTPTQHQTGWQQMGPMHIQKTPRGGF
jgi:hypothetical protein